METMQAAKKSGTASPAELFIVGFPGTTPPQPLLSRYRRGDYAGLIFFARNFSAPGDALATAAYLRELTESYQPSAAPLQGLPPILAIDHEGGRVQRLKAPLTVWPPMDRLRGRPEALAEQVGRAQASELRALGLNVNFAPVLDVMTNPQNPIIGDRAFGHTPSEAATQGLAFLRGLESVTGMRGCGKHFPGHGDTETDSHLTLPVVRRNEATLRAVELLPFVAAARAGIGMLMTAHVVYPAVDARPATLSKRWLTDILRDELGFSGVVVSDDLDMNAVTAQHLQIADDSAVVVEALLAGCDAFLFCRDQDRLLRAEEALIRAAETRSEVRERIAESAARVRTFRQTLRTGTADEDYLRSLPSSDHAALRSQLLATP